jgi:DnaJ family protein C protein 3
MRTRSVLTLPIALFSLSSAVLGESSRTAEQAAADGTRLLAAGSYSEAARAYTEAIGAFHQLLVLEQLYTRCPSSMSWRAAEWDCGLDEGRTDPVELDNTSYSNYYKRATAYISLGRNGAAIDDLDRIVELNPAFVQVRQPHGPSSLCHTETVFR